MAKNVLITVLILVIGVFVTLFVTDKVKWVSEEEMMNNPEDILERGIEMHRPQVLEIGDQQVMYIPTGRVTGRNWTVSHAFYIFEEGKLKKLDF